MYKRNFLVKQYQILTKTDEISDRIPECWKFYGPEVVFLFCTRV